MNRESAGQRTWGVRFEGWVKLSQGQGAIDGRVSPPKSMAKRDARANRQPGLSTFVANKLSDESLMSRCRKNAEGLGVILQLTAHVPGCDTRRRGRRPRQVMRAGLELRQSRVADPSRSGETESGITVQSLAGRKQ